MKRIVLLADITDKIRRYPNNYSGGVPGRYIELAVLTSTGSAPLVCWTEVNTNASKCGSVKRCVLVLIE